MSTQNEEDLLMFRDHSFERNVQEQGYFMCVFLSMLLFSEETETHLNLPNHKRKDAVHIRVHL